MRHFIFCHGFGFDNSFWCNLAPYFMQEKCTYLDLGYFGEGYFPEIIKNDDLLIGVGHSLGMAKLLQLDIKFDYLIGLNAFSNFLGNDSSLRMKRKADLEILKKHFTKYPKKSLKEFHRRCGVSIAIGDQKIDGRKLLWDLDFLEINFKIPEHIPKAVGKLDSILSGEHSECTEKYMSTRIHDKTENQFAHREGYTKLMIIGTKDDIIVPLELIHDNFAQYEIMEQGGHALGFKEPEAIYQKIIEFTNDS